MTGVQTVEIIKSDSIVYCMGDAENARSENAAPNWLQGWKMQETTLYGTQHIAYVYTYV